MISLHRNWYKWKQEDNLLRTWREDRHLCSAHLGAVTHHHRVFLANNCIKEKKALMFVKRQYTFHCHLEKKVPIQKKVRFHGQNRSYFLVSKITPRQRANTRQEQSYNRISAESMNIFIFTRLGTRMSLRNHVHPCSDTSKKTTASMSCRITCWKVNYSQKIPARTIH